MAQITALEQALLVPRYEREVLRYLRAEHPRAAGVADRSDDEVLSLIRRWRERASALGAIDAAGWGEFAELALAFGDDFDRQPWAQAAWQAIDPASPAPRRWSARVSAVVAAAVARGAVPS